MQGVLSWVAQPTPGTEPASFEARLYEPLFRSANPSELGDSWMDDVNPESLTTVTGALAPPRLANAHVGDRSVPLGACARVPKPGLAVACTCGMGHAIQPDMITSGPAPYPAAVLRRLGSTIVETVRLNPTDACRFQLERLGYFYVDPDSIISDTGCKLVINRTCTLRDSFQKTAAAK